MLPFSRNEQRLVWWKYILLLPAILNDTNLSFNIASTNKMNLEMRETWRKLQYYNMTSYDIAIFPRR